jgi:hypothetical protein
VAWAEYAAIRDEVTRQGAPWSPTDRLVALAIADHLNPDGKAWPSLARLCDWTGLSRAAVKVAIKRLCGASDGVFSLTPGGSLPGGERKAHVYASRAAADRVTKRPGHGVTGSPESRDRVTRKPRPGHDVTPKYVRTSQMNFNGAADAAPGARPVEPEIVNGNGWPGNWAVVLTEVLAPFGCFEIGEVGKHLKPLKEREAFGDVKAAVERFAASDEFRFGLPYFRRTFTNWSAEQPARPAAGSRAEVVAMSNVQNLLRAVK